jgi:type III pantothenate kinase
MKVEIDAGNSRIKWRVCLDQIVESRGIFSNKDIEMFLKVLDQIPSIENIYIASVSHPSILNKIDKYSSKRGCSLIEAKTKKITAGVTCGYSDPSILGIDRWLGIVAAYNRFRLPCIIIDAGTTLTIDIVSGNGKHLGGYILPGKEMSRNIMNTGAQQIQINIDNDQNITNLSPGNSTEECVAKGQILMIKSLIEYVVKNSEERNETQIIVTGGDAQDIINILGSDVHFDPELILNGLKFLDL